jgi:hypothetical protein
MGIIAIIFSAPASPLPLHGERVGERGLFSVFLEGESKRIRLASGLESKLSEN